MYGVISFDQRCRQEIHSRSVRVYKVEYIHFRRMKTVTKIEETRQTSKDLTILRQRSTEEVLAYKMSNRYFLGTS